MHERPRRPVTNHGRTNASEARRLVENARRERSHREGWLGQVGAGKVVEHGQLQRAGQRGGMAGTAGAALVHRIGLCAGGLAGAVLGGLLGVLCGLVVMIRMPVSMLVLDTVVSPGGLGGHSCRRTGVSGFAEDHGCRRVRLEGYGEHHDPKDEQANPIHAPHSNWGSVSGGLCGHPVLASIRRDATLRAAPEPALLTPLGAVKGAPRRSTAPNSGGFCAPCNAANRSPPTCCPNFQTPLPGGAVSHRLGRAPLGGPAIVAAIATDAGRADRAMSRSAVTEISFSMAVSED